MTLAARPDRSVPAPAAPSAAPFMTPAVDATSAFMWAGRGQSWWLPRVSFCGEKRRIIAHGNCRRCLVNNPETTRTFAEGLARRLGPGRPPWYYAFVTHVVERYSPSEARGRLRDSVGCWP